jgi:hypothetical protein
VTAPDRESRVVLAAIRAALRLTDPSVGPATVAVWCRVQGVGLTRDEARELLAKARERAR